MKRLLIPFFALVMAIHPCLHPLRAMEMNFGAAPYEAGKGIIGTGGWQARLAGDEDKAIAEVVNVRWDDGTPALMLKGASLKNAEFGVPDQQGMVTFSCQIAFNFTTGPKASGRPFRLSIRTAPFSEIYFDRSPEGGLGFSGDPGGRQGGTVMLSSEELKPNSFYRFTAVMDYDNGTYTLELTGTKRDGTPLNYNSGELTFEVTPALRTNIGRVNHLIASDVITVYLRDLKIE